MGHPRTREELEGELTQALAAGKLVKARAIEHEIKSLEIRQPKEK